MSLMFKKLFPVKNKQNNVKRLEEIKWNNFYSIDYYLESYKIPKTPFIDKLMKTTVNKVPDYICLNETNKKEMDYLIKQILYGNLTEVVHERVFSDRSRKSYKKEKVKYNKKNNYIDDIDTQSRLLTL